MHTGAAMLHAVTQGAGSSAEVQVMPRTRIVAVHNVPWSLAASTVTAHSIPSKAWCVAWYQPEERRAKV